MIEILTTSTQLYIFPHSCFCWYDFYEWQIEKSELAFCENQYKCIKPFGVEPEIFNKHGWIGQYHGCWCLTPYVARTSASAILTTNSPCFPQCVVLSISTISWPGNVSMMTSSNGNIFRVTGLLCWEFTGHRWIPCTKDSDAELWCFLWTAPEPTVKLTMETPVIWDAIVITITSL